MRQPVAGSALTEEKKLKKKRKDKGAWMRQHVWLLIFALTIHVCFQFTILPLQTPICRCLLLAFVILLLELPCSFVGWFVRDKISAAAAAGVLDASGVLDAA